MLTCKQLAELASDYLDRRLSAAERGEVEAHLSSCPACRAHVRQIEVTVKALGHLPDEPPPAAVKTQLLAAFRLAHPPLGDRSSRELRFSERLSRVHEPVGVLDLVEGFLGGARGFAMAAVVLSGLLLSLLRAGMHTGALGPGAFCFGVQLASGILPLVPILYLARAEHRHLSVANCVGVAAAGSVLGVAVLELVCDLKDVVPHVLAFHVTGLAAALVLASLGPRFLPAR